MRAMQLHQLNEPMQLDDIPAPDPKPGEVQVRVHTCGINFGDTLIVQGKYQEKFALPFTPGMEICGTVSALGDGVSGLAIGTRIAAYGGTGGLAEYTCLAADRCIPVPDNMPDDQVAAFLVAYGTSHVALDYRAKLQKGETLLVLGASGGIGLTAVELGKLMGAKVIAVARGQAKLDIARQAGADHLIDSETQDIREIVKSLGGADVVYDPVGGDQFKAAMRACNPEARIIPLGFASGDIPQIPANILLVKNITVIGFYWGGYATFAPKVLINSFTELFKMYAAGNLHPHVSHILPLEQANEALALLRDRKSTGKVVVQVYSAA
ncbi:MAG: NADPH:quinone oxidoreductase family protein [Rhodobacteraceae bacterium]|nr:NADPH:quinone oxidoreductase family protein [Paracoccaceae bacterium]